MIILFTGTYHQSVSNGHAHELAACPCFGVERMLMGCPRYLKLLPRSNCYWKVTVLCNKNAVGEFQIIISSQLKFFSYFTASNSSMSEWRTDEK